MSIRIENFIKNKIYAGTHAVSEIQQDLDKISSLDAEAETLKAKWKKYTLFSFLAVVISAVASMAAVAIIVTLPLLLITAICFVFSLIKMFTSGSLDTEDEAVEHEGGGENDPCLKPATRSEIAVELHVESEEKDEGDKHFGDNAQDDLIIHASLSSPLSLNRRARPIIISTPTPAVKMTAVSPSVSYPR